MAIDKRTVTTDALETLGMLISEKEGRDAIHLAVENVVAAQSLHPGQHVGFIDGGVGKCIYPVGIVDPFLTNRIKKGERFWLVVYPRRITSLRHVWTHPDIPDRNIVGNVSVQDDLLSDSKQYLLDCANQFVVSYDEFIQGVKDALERGVYEDDDNERIYIVIKIGIDIHTIVNPEFWHHFYVVTGLDPEIKPNYFSCSC